MVIDDVLGTSTISHIFSSNESVPFRFTPNIQQFVTPVGTEALLVPGIVAIARALTKPEVRALHIPQDHR